MNLNRLIMGGRLARDPELKFTPTGTAIASMTIVVNRQWKDQNGEAKEEVGFFDSTAFGKTAESIAQYFRKGSNILIEGRIKMEQWEDRETHKNRTAIKVIVESFQFIDRKADDSAPQAQRPSETPRAAINRATAPVADPANDYPDNDDVPF